MTITFDQLLETITRVREPEPGFSIQADVHKIASIIFEWKNDNLTNAQAASMLNLDLTDPELATVKVFLTTLSKADTLSLHHAMLLAEDVVTTTGVTYDKALLRLRFGLVV